MVERAPFLDRAYGAYHHRAVPPVNDVLQKSGPGTPCGEYLRRFWQPVVHAASLKDLPVSIKIMHEDLVAFRDKSGRVGLLQKRCCHRGTSLEFAKIEDRGIRCCYHGWQFDVDGTILDIPTEPADGTLKNRLFQGAYPVREFAGLVFAYMGPPEHMPPFPLYDTLDVPGYHLEHAEPVGVSNVKPCNWLQILDNVADPVHEAFLHTRISGVQFFDKNDKPMIEMGDIGELVFQETPIGMICQEVRRIQDAIWVRSLEVIYPNIAQIGRAPVFPPELENGGKERAYMPLLTRWRVPVDDEHTVEYAFVRLRDGENNPYTDNQVPAWRTNYGDRPYEERQRMPGDYEAIVEQGPITRHGTEHLVASDRGVTMFRRATLKGIEAVQNGEDPKPLDLFRRANGPIPTHASETVIHSPPQPGADDAKALRDAATFVYEKGLERSVANRPNPTCV